MFFTSPEERTEVLERIKSQPRLVPYGAAMDHAISTQLGIWGDVEGLTYDCAQILACELLRYVAENPNSDVSYCFQILRRENPEELAKAILYCETFNLAFDKARSRDQKRLGLALDCFRVRNHGFTGELSKEAQSVDIDNIHETLCLEVAKIVDRARRSEKCHAKW